jgi:pimeloyl-ACP methyl ester carboxylesterase
MLINLADQVVSPEQVEPLRAAILSFMKASHLDMVDKAAAALEFAHAREMERALPEPARTYMGYVNDRNVPALGKLLLPHVALFENIPALSPELTSGITAPVFLIHGADDNVVPASESRMLAERLSGQVPVQLLITPLITHAEVDRGAGVVDIWRLIRFWYALLNA